MLVLLVTAACAGPERPSKATYPLEAMGGTVDRDLAAVTIQRRGDGQAEVHVRVEALPGGDQPDTHYVVWGRPHSHKGATYRLGKLTRDPDGSYGLHILVPDEPFDLLVTTEGSLSVEKPSGEQILWGSLNDRGRRVARR